MAIGSVKIETPSKRSGVTLRQALGRVSTGVAFGLASRIQRRVFQRGRPAQRPPPHDGEGIKLVSPRYDARGGRTTKAGARLFRSGLAFQHAQRSRPGAYNVSGGLARGLSVIPGRTNARVQFRGRSEGQEVVWRQRKGGLVAKGKKVSNALKAATVLKATGINVLALTQEELEAVSLAVQHLSRQAIPDVGGYKIRWRGGGLASSAARELVAASRGLLAK